MCNTNANMADTGWQVRAIDTVLQNCFSIFVSQATFLQHRWSFSANSAGDRTMSELGIEVVVGVATVAILARVALGTYELGMYRLDCCSVQNMFYQRN